MKNTSNEQPVRIPMGKAPTLSRCQVAAFAVVACFTLISCGKHPAQQDKPSSGDSVANPSATANVTKVEVPPAGRQFSPPVRADQLPTGAWYCDMGTVHWAQMNQGNHQCPLCKMDLKHKN
jgi:hypothetical protein